MSQVAAVEVTSESSAPEASRRRLLWLLAAHALLPIVMRILLWTLRPGMSFAGYSIGMLPLYQVLLVGMWAGLGQMRFWQRAVVLLAGTSYVVVVWMTLASFGGGIYDALLHIVTATLWYLLIAVICAGTLLLLRLALYDLRRVPQPQAVDRNYRSRLGVRHMLLLTLVCALLITGTQLPHSLVGGNWPIVITLVMIAVVGWMALWATLTPGRYLARAALCLAAAVGVAALASVQYKIDAREAYSIVPGLVLTIASLLVVRSAGFRLLRRPADTLTD
jgi:hypothetical protein